MRIAEALRRFTSGEKTIWQAKQRPVIQAEIKPKPLEAGAILITKSFNQVMFLSG